MSNKKQDIILLCACIISAILVALMIVLVVLESMGIPEAFIQLFA